MVRPIPFQNLGVPVGHISCLNPQPLGLGHASGDSLSVHINFIDNLLIFILLIRKIYSSVYMNVLIGVVDCLNQFLSNSLKSSQHLNLTEPSCDFVYEGFDVGKIAEQSCII